MTIHTLPLTELDHTRAERLIMQGMVGCEIETPIGHLSVSVHGLVYLRTKERTVPMEVPEARRVIHLLQSLTNIAANQVRIRSEVANDCEATTSDRRSRLWRKLGGALKKAMRK
jgi:hypothetical protein